LYQKTIFRETTIRFLKLQLVLCVCFIKPHRNFPAEPN
jgi:hypothetical protein